jgi:hypothetical protein
MKNLVLIVTFLFAGAGFLTADPAATPAPPPTAVAPAAPAGPAPKIQFATPVYEFGKAKAGEPVKYTFIFTNTGDATLELSNVQPSCGCTTAGEWTRKVEPGQTGSIPIQVNTANFNGPIFKSVTVTSNDKTQPAVSLQVKGTVWKPIDVNPQFAVLNVTPDSQEATTVVKIVNNGEEPMTLSAPESNNKAFSVSLKEVQPGKNYELTVKTVPPLSPGNVQGQISLKSSTKDMPEVKITAWANVQPPYTVTPATLMLPAGPLPAKTPLAVTVQNNSTNAMTLSNPTINAKDVAVNIQELQAGRTFRANIVFPQGFEAPVGEPLELTIQPNQASAIKVPISRSPKIPNPPGSPAGAPIKSAGVAPAPPLPPPPHTAGN